MIFALRPGLIVVCADTPGNHATLFGPDGNRLVFVPGACRFDDGRREYEWAFAHGAALVTGQRFVFAVAGWDATGEVADDGSIRVSDTRLNVLRETGGKPLKILSAMVFPTASPIKRGAASNARVSLVERHSSSARVLAIFPGVQTPGAGWGSHTHASANNESAYMAHGMSYISAYLKSRGHQVWLLDTRVCSGWQHFIEEVRRFDYDFAMLGPLSIEAFTAACIVRVLKEEHPDRPVIFGGLHTSMTKDKAFPPDDLPKFYFYQEPPSRMREFLNLKGEGVFEPSRWPKADYLIWNEGELATAAIVEGADLRTGDWDYEETPSGTVFLNGKIVPDLNKMPHMDRELFNEEMEKQHPLLPELPAPFHTITFGRGCPYKCSFCSVGVQFSSTSVRLLDPDYFMDALHEIKTRNGGHIGSLMIHDDILLFPSWLQDWNEKIKQQFGYIPYWCQIRADFICKHPDLMKHMAEAGMCWVSVGFEVGHARGLNGIMNKGLKVIGIDDPVEINIKAAEVLKSIGVNAFGNFMFGNPTETNEEMDATVAMIQRIQPQHHGFSTYCGFPGTPLQDFAEREGLVMQEWYTRSHYPWQYRIRGVDYDHVNRCITRAAQTPKRYVNPSKLGLWKR